MPIDELTGLLKEFNVRAEKDLVKAKTTDKQTRAISSGAPVPVELTADKCKKLCEAAGLVYKTGYESRVLQYRTTNEVVDRYGDIVRAKGGDFKTTYFPDNPIMMYSHMYESLPVGNTIKIWYDAKDKAIPAYGLFMDNDTDKTGWSDIVFTIARAGFMRACSIGFLPRTYNSPKTQEERDKLGLGTWGIEYLTWEYLEWSPCGIPANPQALNNYIKENQKNLSLRFINKEFIDRVAKVKLFEDENTLDTFSSLCVGNSCFKVKTPQINIIEKGDPDDGGTWKYCVCKSCGYYEDHEAGKPCGKCPECGEQMQGSKTKPKKDLKMYAVEYIEEGNFYSKEIETSSWEEAETEAIEKYNETAKVVGEIIDGITYNKDGNEIKDFYTEYMSLGFKCCNTIKSTSWEEAQKVADLSEFTDEVVLGVIDLKSKDLDILDKKGNKISKAGELVKQNELLFSVLDFGKNDFDSDEFINHFNVSDVKDFKLSEINDNDHTYSLPKIYPCEKYMKGTRKHNGKVYTVVFGKQKGTNIWEQHLFSYQKDVWSENDIRNHSKDYRCSPFKTVSSKVVEVKEVKPPVVNINLDGSNELINAIKEFTKSVDKFSDIVGKLKPDAQIAVASVEDEDYTDDSIHIDKLETDINI